MKSPWIGLALAIAMNQTLSGTLFFYLGGLICIKLNSDIFEIRNVKATTSISLLVLLLTFFIVVPQNVLLFASLSLFVSISNIEIENKYLLAVTKSLSTCIFFIYATHEPTITVLERLCRKFPISSDTFKYIEFIGLPITAILITWTLALFAKRHFNKLYLISTGMR